MPLSDPRMLMAAEVARPRILIADDHPIVLEGLCRVLERDFEIVGTARDGRELVEAAENLGPGVHVVITDISMPLLNGLDAVRKIRERLSNARIVLLTVHDDAALAAEALDAGARGYVLKQSAARELARAVRTVLKGNTYISPRLGRRARELLYRSSNVPREFRLTPREREVLQLLAEGFSSKEAASVLGISPRTIEFHKTNIMSKTGFDTIAELARYASRIGLV